MILLRFIYCVSKMYNNNNAIEGAALQHLEYLSIRQQGVVQDWLSKESFVKNSSKSSFVTSVINSVKIKIFKLPINKPNTEQKLLCSIYSQTTYSNDYFF